MRSHFSPSGASLAPNNRTTDNSGGLDAGECGRNLMIIVIAASWLPGEGKCHECTNKHDRSTRERTRIHLRASDSLGRKEPQPTRGSDPCPSDAGPDHRD